jgi:hypothetical protein
MATPRRPEPPNRMGITGLLFLLLIIGGIAWLLMLIFGWGPYASESIEDTSTPTLTQETMVSFSPSPTFSITLSPQPTQTFTPSQTPTSTATPTPEVYPFVLNGEPLWMSYKLIRPQLSCEYLIIAGEVKDLKDLPVLDSATIHLYGALAGNTIDRFALPGSSTIYGESGYEFILEGLVLDGIDSLQIRLEDTNGLPLSSAYAIQTYEDCERNLILVNFKQVR